MGAAVLEGWEGRVALTVLAAEHWMPPSRASGDITADGLFRPPQETPPPEGKGRRGRKATQQSELRLVDDRGRFKNVAPTIHDGADLDIPTFMRRGIRIPTK